MRALEPDAVGAHRAAIRDLTAQRAQHLQPRECGCQRHVPPLARLQGQGQGVREYYQVFANYCYLARSSLGERLIKRNILSSSSK